MFLVQCEESRINHLTPLLAVTMPYPCWFLWWADYIENFKWRLHFQLGVAFWRAESRLKGIEDFDLIATCSTRSHQQLNCRLQADRQLEGMLAWFSAKVLLIHDLITSVLSSAVRFVLLNSRAKQGSRLHRHMQKVTLDTLVAIKVPCHTGSYYISLRISFSNQLPFVI